MFACGTAAVITPVGRVKGASGGWTVADGAPGPVTMRLRKELIGIQYGRLARPLRLDPQGLLTARNACGEHARPARDDETPSRMLRQTRQSANGCGKLVTVTSGRIIIGWRVGT